jgi:hypothetical protein
MRVVPGVPYCAPSDFVSTVTGEFRGIFGATMVANPLSRRQFIGQDEKQDLPELGAIENFSLKGHSPHQ